MVTLLLHRSDLTPIYNTDLRYLKGYFLVFRIHVLSPKERATRQPNSQEIFLQVLNLADDEVKVTVLGDENNTLLEAWKGLGQIKWTYVC